MGPYSVRGGYQPDENGDCQCAGCRAGRASPKKKIISAELALANNAARAKAGMRAGLYKLDKRGEYVFDSELPIGAQRQSNRLPDDSAERKAIPLIGGLLDYFPDALAAVAIVSKHGNDKHNPGEAMHWARDKSNDHAECIARHLVDRGGFDAEGVRHSASLAWRALAHLQVELERELGLPKSRGSQ
jgi:Domain of unknown function (DUF5664)